MKKWDFSKRNEVIDISFFSLAIVSLRILLVEIKEYVLKLKRKIIK